MKDIWRLSEANDSNYFIGNCHSERTAIEKATKYSVANLTAVQVSKGNVIGGEFHESETFVIEEE